jgi:hypothetical protein
MVFGKKLEKKAKFYWQQDNKAGMHDLYIIIDYDNARNKKQI